ncbi:hypothetical protein P7K49_039895, partial [Saguinus oedipus]
RELTLLFCWGKHHLQWRMIHLIWIHLRLLLWPSLWCSAIQSRLHFTASFREHIFLSQYGEHFGERIW